MSKLDPKTEAPLAGLHQRLQKLVTFHRQMLDVVRLEREALVSADLKAVQECTFKKEVLIATISDVEAERIEDVAALALAVGVAPDGLRLSQIVQYIEPTAPEMAKSLQSTWNALSVLCQRIQEQNDENRRLAEGFLSHLNEMKRNVLGEGQPHTSTYSATGQKSGPTAAPRLFEKEA